MHPAFEVYVRLHEESRACLNSRGISFNILLLNPYVLDVPFYTLRDADRINQRREVPLPDDKYERVNMKLLEEFKGLLRNTGHMFVYISEVPSDRLEMMKERKLVVVEDDRVYGEKEYRDEKTIKDFFSKDMRVKCAVKIPIRDDELNDEQRAFVQKYNNGTSHFILVNSPAGTGKTYMERYISEHDRKVLFVTPTHQSKKVLLKYIGNPYVVMLIHTVVYTNQPEFLPHTIFIDEASMVDCGLLAALIRKFPKARYILMGDINQLPPVARGYPFKHLCRRYGSLNMTINYRSNQTIQMMLSKILRKELVPPIAGMFIDIETAVQKFIEKPNESVIISHENRTVDDINNRIHRLLFPDNTDTFAMGSKLVCINNRLPLYKNGDTLIYNGEDIVQKNKECFKLAYAITIHKSQGSQYNVVILVPGRHYLSTRQLTYTAVSRAKEQLYIVCSDNRKFLAHYLRDEHERNSTI